MTLEDKQAHAIGLMREIVPLMTPNALELFMERMRGMQDILRASIPTSQAKEKKDE